MGIQSTCLIACIILQYDDDCEKKRSLSIIVCTLALPLTPDFTLQRSAAFNLYAQEACVRCTACTFVRLNPCLNADHWVSLCSKKVRANCCVCSLRTYLMIHVALLNHHLNLFCNLCVKMSSESEDRTTSSSSTIEDAPATIQPLRSAATSDSGFDGAVDGTNQSASLASSTNFNRSLVNDLRSTAIGTPPLLEIGRAHV